MTVCSDARTVPFRAIPKPGESILSFMTRTAEANLYESIGWLVEGRADRRWDVGTWSDKKRGDIAELIGIDALTFDSMTYTPHQRAGRLTGDRHFLGSRAPYALIDISKRKYCSACLLEDGYHHSFFDLTVVSACPRHCISLRSSCPRCNHRLNWGGSHISSCGNCNYDLTRTEPEYFPAEQAHGIATLARRLNFPVADSLGLEWPTRAKSFDIGESIELLSALHQLKVAKRMRDGGFPRFHGDDPNEYIQGGYEVLIDWPKRFNRVIRDALNSLPHSSRAARSHEGMLQFARICSPHYDRLADKEEQPWHFLRQRVDTLAYRRLKEKSRPSRYQRKSNKSRAIPEGWFIW